MYSKTSLEIGPTSISERDSEALAKRNLFQGVAEGLQHIRGWIPFLI